MIEPLALLWQRPEDAGLTIDLLPALVASGAMFYRTLCQANAARLQALERQAAQPSRGAKDGHDATEPAPKRKGL